MKFLATKQEVSNRGVPPDSFLAALATWGCNADDAIFAPNNSPLEIFTVIRPQLGPWSGEPMSQEWLLQRKASMLEAMRVHAGFESSWNWDEGVDVTNKTSMAHKTGQEAGIFQCSFDSEWIANGYMKAFAQVHDIDTPEKFIPAMKANHGLALEYYARLVRVNIRWAGPLVRAEINPWLRRDAMEEFRTLLTM